MLHVTKAHAPTATQRTQQRSAAAAIAAVLARSTSRAYSCPHRSPQPHAPNALRDTEEQRPSLASELESAATLAPPLSCRSHPCPERTAGRLHLQPEWALDSRASCSRRCSAASANPRMEAAAAAVETTAPRTAGRPVGMSRQRRSLQRLPHPAATTTPLRSPSIPVRQWPEHPVEQLQPLLRAPVVAPTSATSVCRCSWLAAGPIPSASPRTASRAPSPHSWTTTLRRTGRSIRQ